jgi:SAM-dependent methyltransferase
VTLAERAAHYSVVFPDRPPMHASGRWLEGTWIGGNNYKGSGYYGAYPPDYLERIWAVFPDYRNGQFMHLFSGSLTAEAGGIRVDIRDDLPSPQDVRADALALPFADAVFGLVLADTPYGRTHAERYGTTMPDRKAVIREAARVTKPGGFLVWLDTKLPMFRKSEWHWCGVIQVIRSTNHDFRGASIFQRVGR